MFKEQFGPDAWKGFAQMFAAAHGMVSKADGDIADSETQVMMNLIDGRRAGAPASVLESFDADPALAREVLSDSSAIIHEIAPDDGGAAAMRAPEHLLQWVQSSSSNEEQEARARLLRGLLVEMMYLGLETAAADGYFDANEYQTWLNLGDAFGLSSDWLDRLRRAAVGS